jgi:hypothetical protein
MHHKSSSLSVFILQMALLLLFKVFLLCIDVYSIQVLDNSLWQEYPFNPVYDPIGRAYYPSVLYDAPIYKMWTSDGSGGTTLETSPDGIVWTFIANCTGLTNSHHISVIKTAANSYEIWYWDFNSPGAPYSNESIRHASSSDGIDWINDTVILQDPVQLLINTSAGPPTPWNRGSYGPGVVLYNSSVTLLDSVNIMNNRYVMYYDGTTGGDESIGVAASVDGVNWVGNPTGLPVFGVLDTTYSTRPAVVIWNCDCLRFHMWYSYGVGNPDFGIGYAESVDGLVWEMGPNNPIFSINDSLPTGTWRLDRTYTACVIEQEVPNIFRMWFSGKNGSNYAIGYATLVVPTTTAPTTTTTTTNAPTPTATPAPTLSPLSIFGICISCFVVFGLALCTLSMYVQPRKPNSRKRWTRGPQKMHLQYVYR